MSSVAHQTEVVEVVLNVLQITDNQQRSETEAYHIT